MVRIALFTFILVSQLGYSQDQQPFEVTLLHAPTPVTIDGVNTIYCELLVRNRSNDSITVTKVSGTDLVKSLSVSVPSNSFRAIYLELELKSPRPVLTFDVEIIANGARSVSGVIVNVDKGPPVKLGPPLRSGPWTAIYWAGWERGHRRVIYSPTGTPKIPGRFAIDFVKVDSKGKVAKGDANIVSNYFGYGEDVLAVADGTIVSIRDDFSESATRSDHVNPPAENATGNYIAIDLGNGRFAFYEHLKPNSIKVESGQKVKKGDVIASLGFTGQASEPHLHFSVADANSPLDAEGVPFTFDSFELLGNYPNLDKFGKEPAVLVKKKIIRNERPGPNSLVKFDR